MNTLISRRRRIRRGTPLGSTAPATPTPVSRQDGHSAVYVDPAYVMIDQASTPEHTPAVTQPATVARGVDFGPWDISELDAELAAEQAANRHSLDTTIDFVSARVDIARDYLARVEHSAVAPVPAAGMPTESGIPTWVRFTSAVGTSISLAVLAEPRNAQRWESGLAERIAGDLGEGIPHSAAVAGAHVGLWRGPTGTQVRSIDQFSRTRSVHLGVDGPRWTALVTVTGTQVHRHDRVAAYNLLQSLVVHRGIDAAAPDAALSMQLLAAGTAAGAAA